MNHVCTVPYSMPPAMEPCRDAILVKGRMINGSINGAMRSAVVTLSRPRSRRMARICSRLLTGRMNAREI